MWALLASTGAQGASAEFRRGIAISHELAWAPVEAKRFFTNPPFTAPTDRFRRELRTIRDSGFDFVRLAVDPGPFLQFRGAMRDRLDHILMDYVQTILAADLGVIVDFHPGDIHPDFTADQLTRGAYTSLFREFLQLLTRTAGLLDGLRSRRVALEIMNEPPARPDTWAPMLEAAYTAIRGRAPTLALVLDGGDDKPMVAFRTLTRFRHDPAVLFNFHYYEPYQFTHQGAPWMAARYLADVPYPAVARPLSDSLDASAALVAAAKLPASQDLMAKLNVRKQLESYRRSAFDRADVSKTFDSIAQWAREQGVPARRMILGEFGVRNHMNANGSRAGERWKWIRDVREEAEARGFPWVVWVYRGSGGFALVDGEGTALDAGTAAALGLNAKTKM